MPAKEYNKLIIVFCFHFENSFDIHEYETKASLFYFIFMNVECFLICGDYFF